jgi:hypothetical protein
MNSKLEASSRGALVRTTFFQRCLLVFLFSHLLIACSEDKRGPKTSATEVLAPECATDTVLRTVRSEISQSMVERAESVRKESGDVVLKFVDIQFERITYKEHDTGPATILCSAELIVSMMGNPLELGVDYGWEVTETNQDRVIYVGSLRNRLPKTTD